MSTTPVSPYFELSWSILSSIGLMNVIFGFLVAGITNFSPIAAVPIVVSAAGAVANGMCYYAFYADYPQTPVVVAGAFADIMWLIQEAGMSFYSYQILIRVLRGRDRVVFLSCFWSMMVIILGIRTVILVSRVMDNISESDDLQPRINNLHVGYFVSIAIVESLSSFYLLRIFAFAKRSSAIVYSKGGLFKHLTRSTEIRLTTLTVTGVTRAITYSFQTTAQSATSVASQVDRFAYTLECLFPIVMMIDNMGSKLMVATHNFEASSTSRSHRNGTSDFELSAPGEGGVYSSKYGSRKPGIRIKASSGGTSADQGPVFPLSSIETRVDAQMHTSSSEEHIIGSGSRAEQDDIRENPFTETLKPGGISKTVEFEFRESKV